MLTEYSCTCCRLFCDACKSNPLPYNLDVSESKNFTISYAYFHDLPQADLPYIKIPLHTVIKLTPKAYGCDEERYEFRSATAVAITDI